jgi:hypothetical protein
MLLKIQQGDRVWYEKLGANDPNGTKDFYLLLPTQAHKIQKSV